MKRSTWTVRRTVALVAILAVIAGATALAAGKIAGQFSSSSSIPTFTKMPSAAQMEETLGFVPPIVEEFANGYTFASGVEQTSGFTDEDGKHLSSFTAFACTYKSGDDELYLDVYPLTADDALIEHSGTPLKLSDGTTAYFSEFDNKFVAGDYVLTEQDKIDEASGKYVFSYGIARDEILHIAGLSWQRDGFSWSLTVMDSPLTQADFLAMAEELHA